MKRSKIIFMIIGFIVIILLSVSLSFYIQNQLKNESDAEIEVLIVIDFGTLNPSENYTEQYVNVTEGTSALEAFSLVANLTVTNYPFGAYIKGVDGYMESLPDFWIFYYYDIELDDWMYSSVGVSHYYLQEWDKIKLQYSG
jgi:hypothetical protein